MEVHPPSAEKILTEESKLDFKPSDTLHIFINIWPGNFCVGHSVDLDINSRHY